MSEVPGKLEVSVIILNYNYPHNIARLLPSLQKTSDVNYETVVVDNGSTPDVVNLLESYRDQGIIDTLVLESVNHYYSVGKNIGVRHSDPTSEFILLLDNDTEIFNGLWLRRMIEWAEGVPETLLPYTWSDLAVYPKDEHRGIISIGGSAHDLTIPGHIRPDGWCCLIRREAWRDMSPDFPMQMADLEMMAGIVRDGYPCGVLHHFQKYIVHHAHGSPIVGVDQQVYAQKIAICPRQPDPIGWWAGLKCDGLDFALDHHRDLLPSGDVCAVEDWYVIHPFECLRSFLGW